MVAEGNARQSVIMLVMHMAAAMLGRPRGRRLGRMIPTTLIPASRAALVPVWECGAFSGLREGNVSLQNGVAGDFRLRMRKDGIHPFRPFGLELPGGRVARFAGLDFTPNSGRPKPGRRGFRGRRFLWLFLESPGVSGGPPFFVGGKGGFSQEFFYCPPQKFFPPPRGPPPPGVEEVGPPRPPGFFLWGGGPKKGGGPNISPPRRKGLFKNTPPKLYL